MLKGKDELGKDFPDTALLDDVPARTYKSARSRDESASFSEVSMFGINHNGAKISSLTVLHHDTSFSRRVHPVDKADDVEMFNSPQQLHFVKHILFQRSSDSFDRNILAWFSLWVSLSRNIPSHPRGVRPSQPPQKCLPLGVA